MRAALIPPTHMHDGSTHTTRGHSQHDDSSTHTTQLTAVMTALRLHFTDDRAALIPHTHSMMAVALMPHTHSMMTAALIPPTLDDTAMMAALIPHTHSMMTALMTTHSQHDGSTHTTHSQHDGSGSTIPDSQHAAVMPHTHSVV